MVLWRCLHSCLYKTINFWRRDNRNTWISEDSSWTIFPIKEHYLMLMDKSWFAMKNSTLKRRKIGIQVNNRDWLALCFPMGSGTKDKLVITQRSSLLLDWDKWYFQTATTTKEGSMTAGLADMVIFIIKLKNINTLDILDKD